MHSPFLCFSIADSATLQKSNDPADLNQRDTRELRDSGWGAFVAPPGPVIPNEADIPAAAVRLPLTLIPTHI